MGAAARLAAVPLPGPTVYTVHRLCCALALSIGLVGCMAAETTPSVPRWTPLETPTRQSELATQSDDEPEEEPVFSEVPT